MTKVEFFLLLLVMAATTYAIRALPLFLIRREIKQPFIRAFLYYVPYVTLTVMTVPAAFEIALPAGEPCTFLGVLPGAIGLLVAALVSLILKNLMLAALLSSLVVWGTIGILSLCA
jgi:branched-subunit amino acid transport protein